MKHLARHLGRLGACFARLPLPMTGLPVRDNDDALRVNWLEITSARPDGAVTYRGTFVTSLDVNRDNVAELADCARLSRRVMHHAELEAENEQDGEWFPFRGPRPVRANRSDQELVLARLESSSRKHL